MIIFKDFEVKNDNKRIVYKMLEKFESIFRKRTNYV